MYPYRADVPSDHLAGRIACAAAAPCRARPGWTWCVIETTLDPVMWVLAPTYAEFDRGLADSLVNLFAGASVVELGAGKGLLRSTKFNRAPPIWARRASACARLTTPNVANITGGLVHRADLTRPMLGPPSEWVLCLAPSTSPARARA